MMPVTTKAPSRCAIHEAGHAVMSWALGLTDPGPMTVVPAEGLFGGICFIGKHADLHTSAEAGYSYLTPLPMVPHRVRRYIESDVMVSLAGEAAEDLFEWDGASNHQPSTAVLTEADQAALKSPEDRKRIARARSRTEPGSTDEDRVLELLMGVHLRDLDLALAHRRLLLLETRRLLRLRRRALLGLAHLLDTHGTLAGERWHNYLETRSAIDGESLAI